MEPALGFGTVHGLGQDAEQERITRHVLGCGIFSAADGLPARTLTELAGCDRNFGAVGIPDRGDYLDRPDYPRTKTDAQGALESRRAWVMEKLQDAVADAGGLVDARGALRASQMSIPCVFVGQIKGHAKCK